MKPPVAVETQAVSDPAIEYFKEEFKTFSKQIVLPANQ
jgi:hypothetical protein